MDRESIDRIISKDRLSPYLKHHKNDLDDAVSHYKANVQISEAFYPYLSVLEIGLKNSINSQLSRRFRSEYWFDSSEFIKLASRFQIDRISEAKSSILREKKEITAGRVVSELSFGFWTSLLDSRFERTLWKSIRHSFSNCPKEIRKRKTMSTKFNAVRKLRNRIFHHESITWNLDVLCSYKKQITEGIDWLDKGLLKWSEDMFRYEKVLEENKTKILNDRR